MGCHKKSQQILAQKAWDFLVILYIYTYQAQDPPQGNGAQKKGVFWCLTIPPWLPSQNFSHPTIKNKGISDLIFVGILWHPNCWVMKFLAKISCQRSAFPQVHDEFCCQGATERTWHHVNGIHSSLKKIAGKTSYESIGRTQQTKKAGWLGLAVWRLLFNSWK